MKTHTKKTILPISLMANVLAAVMLINIAQSKNEPNPDSDRVVSSSIYSNTSTINEAMPDTVAQSKFQQLRKELALEQSLFKRLQQNILGLQDLLNEEHNEAAKVDDITEMLEFGETEEQAWADDNMAILDAALSKETPDPEWRTMATANIHEILQSDAFGDSELVSADCASTFCRVETRFQNQEKTDQFINQFGFQISWSDSSFAKIINHEAGGQTIVYYLSRIGHDLPLAEG